MPWPLLSINVSSNKHQHLLLLPMINGLQLPSWDGGPGTNTLNSVEQFRNVSRPGRWAYPDMLRLVYEGSLIGLTKAETRTHFVHGRLYRLHFCFVTTYMTKKWMISFGISYQIRKLLLWIKYMLVILEVYMKRLQRRSVLTIVKRCYHFYLILADRADENLNNLWS